MRHLEQLGSEIRVPLDPDPEGFVGRECPAETCQRYFKVKSGTGLTGEELLCHCPYCAYSGPNTEFFTKAQIDYAESVALRAIDNALCKDLKSSEFEIKPTGVFGVGISMKLQPSTPVAIKYYKEESLETCVICDVCGLEYAVYGVFAYCPDCESHNSQHILRRNLAIINKQIALATIQDDLELQRHLIEDALENCVSSFDGAAREVVKAKAGKSTNPNKALTISFQNMDRASDRLAILFQVNLPGSIGTDDWNFIRLCFSKRHLIAHRPGVIDQKYLDESGDLNANLGHRVSISDEDVRRLIDTIGRLGDVLTSELNASHP